MHWLQARTIESFSRTSGQRSGSATDTSRGKESLLTALHVPVVKFLHRNFTGLRNPTLGDAGGVGDFDSQSACLNAMMWMVRVFFAKSTVCHGRRRIIGRDDFVP